MSEFTSDHPSDRQPTESVDHGLINIDEMDYYFIDQVSTIRLKSPDLPGSLSAGDTFTLSSTNRLDINNKKVHISSVSVQLTDPS